MKASQNKISFLQVSGGRHYRCALIARGLATPALRSGMFFLCRVSWRPSPSTATDLIDHRAIIEDRGKHKIDGGGHFSVRRARGAN
ncbi:hypothetical protein AAFF_G00341680 [Aldrovandia affinis]|uniref:Uncharacterized protein n=1 Tax=Aldrovandia affinis TaxID=143900 RepID=A0AAD7SL27_9TELE|nr:hypothetical protein AAFF_G00341680 [Aldrovandia affinis]